MMRLPIACFAAAVSIAIGCSAWNVCGATDAAPQTKAASRQAGEQPGSDLDDELLKELEGELGEDDMPAAKKPGRNTDDQLDDDSPQSRPRDENALDDELMRELDQAADEENENAPLSKIGRAMRDVQELVAQAKGGKPTQELQGKIVADLDRLLEAARKRQQQSKSSSSSQSSSRQSASRQSRPGGAGGASDKPAQDSSSALKDRNAARPDPAEMQDLLRDLWGHLPEHERQMVINSTIEQFLPKYELLIEAYFKRLAEETTPK